MKKGRILSTLLSSVMLISTVQGMSTFATAPDIYCDIHYVNETFVDGRDTIYEGYSRIDVMFENFDEIIEYGIHIQLGDGYEPVMNYFGDAVCCDVYTNYNLKINSYNAAENSVFFTIATHDDYLFTNEEDYLNGCFFSIYVKKTNEYSSSNATANVVFTNTDYILKSNGSYYVSPTDDTEIDVSEMLSSNEYIVGDVNGDGRVNTSDASAIFSGISQHNNAPFSVNTINSSFRTWFPNSTCAASPDANEDDIINSSDADDIMEYFGEISSGGTGYLNIGNIEVHEIF